MSKKRPLTVPTAGATCNIYKIKAGGLFTWGVVIRWWEIGDHYDIVEFFDWKTDGFVVRVGHPDYKHKRYHAWVDGKDASHSSNDFDAVLAHVMAVRNDGINTQADKYFIRSIKTDKGHPRHKAQ